MATRILNLDWAKVCGRVKDDFEGKKPDVDSSG